MKQHDFDPRYRLPKRNTDRLDDDKIQYVLHEEEQVLKLISARAPLPAVLNGICGALDRQIGNVVSLFSLPGEAQNEWNTMVRNAELFGLYVFRSEGVFAENGNLLASLEMYCCAPSVPSRLELQAIERATCLAAIAIETDKEAGHRGDCDIPENQQNSKCALDRSVSRN